MKRLVMTLAGMMIFSISTVLGGPIDKRIENILDEYFRIHSALSQDNTDGINETAEKIVALAQVPASSPEATEILNAVRTAAAGLKGKDLAAARNQFFALSEPLLRYLHQHYSGDQQYYRFFCSMAKKGWVQNDQGIRNPYYGSSMLTCGELIGQ